jgi:hypothetical protein
MDDERPGERVARLEQRIEQLERERPVAQRGVRRRSRTRLLGLPLVDIAIGADPSGGSVRGHARGIIAIGDIATGILAIGGISRGVFALGGIAVGVFTFGGASLALLAALGGLAIGGISAGGVAGGGFANGGVAVGVIAEGGVAAGWWARGGLVIARYGVGPDRSDPEAVAMFERLGLPMPSAQRSAEHP